MVIVVCGCCLPVSAPGSRHTMATSGAGKLCGACKAPIVGATSHTCMTCDKPVHSWVMAEDLQCGVWMPENGRYACSKECIEAFNSKQFDEHEALVASWDASDGSPPPCPEPLPLRKRPDAPIESSSALPGMKVTRHHVSEGDGTRGFTPGIADSRGGAGPSSPLGA